MRRPRIAKKLVSSLLLAAFVVLLMLWASGAFRAGHVQRADLEHVPAPTAPAGTALAELTVAPVFEQAFGAVASRRTVAIAAQIGGRIQALPARAGSRVRAGELLVEIDAPEVQARLEQARQALAAADASVVRAREARGQAEALAERTRRQGERTAQLLERGAATEQEREGAEAEHLAGRAGLAGAEAAVAAAQAQRAAAAAVVLEAEITAGHATIRAPIDGLVSERPAEEGDLAWPGRTLLVLLDPEALRLEAQVREGALARLDLDQPLDYEVPAAASRGRGLVAEILPAADPRTRTFEVRVDLEPGRGLLPGMFARLSIPAGERRIVRVPRGALVRVGQLETVLVLDGERWTRRLVTTGRELPDGMLEVLSGLAGGETVGLTEGGGGD